MREFDQNDDRQTVHAWPMRHARTLRPLPWLVLPHDAEDAELIAARLASIRCVMLPQGPRTIETKFRFGGVRVFGQKGSWFVRDVRGVDVWKIDPESLELAELLTWQDLYDHAIEWAIHGMGRTLFHRSFALAPADAVLTGEIPEQLAPRPR